MHSIPTENPTNTHKVIGVLLAFLSLISLFAMLHHPSISATDIQAQITEIKQESSLNATVHAMLIAFTVLISLCITFFAQRQHLSRINVLFGITLYWLGTFAMIIAALISGIISPQLTEILTFNGSAQQDVFLGLRHFNWLVNQAFADFATVCWCIAAILLAFGGSSTSRFKKVFAASSTVTFSTIAISLLSGILTLTVTGMTWVLAALTLWQLGIAWLIVKSD